MSAFVCSTATFDALLTCLNTCARQHRSFYVPNVPPLHNGTTYNLSDPDDLTKLGRMLLTANIESVLYRYPQAKREEYDADYKYRSYPETVSVVMALKLIHCIDYQSCEPPDWEESQARRVLYRMTDFLVSYLPGYPSAPWGIVER